MNSNERYEPNFNIIFINKQFIINDIILRKYNRKKVKSKQNK